ncbi:hypothetical protein D3C73_619530 [compost metagenome]
MEVAKGIMVANSRKRISLLRILFFIIGSSRFIGMGFSFIVTGEVNKFHLMGHLNQC